MIIKRVKRTNVYDVFLGNGWKEHTRISFNKGHVNFIAGKYLKPIQFVAIAKTLEVQQ